MRYFPLYSLFAACVIYIIIFSILYTRRFSIFGINISIGKPFSRLDGFKSTGKLKNTLYSRGFPIIGADVEKREAIKEAFLHAWKNYKKYCWGSDHLDPISKRCLNNLNAGLTIVDSLSTLYIMNLTKEFEAATNFVKNDFKPNGSWSIFEFVIRFLGGFISAYELSGNKLFLEKAKMSADAILPLINKNNGFFGGHLTLKTVDGVIQASGGAGVASLADIGTYQLEFMALAKHTKDPKYMEVALRVYKNLWRRSPNNALLSNFGFNSGDNIRVTIGAAGDSYYEYIIKIYVMLRGKVDIFLKRHLMMIKEIKSRMLFKSVPRNLTAIGEANGRNIVPMQEHLATFAGGMFAVGTVNKNPNAHDDLTIALELAETYYHEYSEMPSGVGPERMRFHTFSDSKTDFSVENGNWMMRPESLESVFYAWRFTGLPKFRDFSWQMFKGINRSSRVENGFAWVMDVRSKNPVQGNIMESFFLAETLKYLYLTFDDTRVISQAEWVFNTEAHPIQIFSEEDAANWSKYIDI